MLNTFPELTNAVFQVFIHQGSNGEPEPDNVVVAADLVIRTHCTHLCKWLHRRHQSNLRRCDRQVRDDDQINGVDIYI